MIMQDGCNTKIKAREIADMLSEMTMLLESVRTTIIEEGKSQEEADSLIDECVRLSRLPDEEIEKEVAECGLRIILDSLFGGGTDNAGSVEEE